MNRLPARTQYFRGTQSGLSLHLSILWAVVWICCVHVAPAQEPAPALRHVVVVVWDGMRPDVMTEKNTPVLWRLAQEGVTFRNHHSVYPTATNVNGTALVTGVYPGRSGILGNHEYRPDIDNRRISDAENPAVVRKGDEISGGKYVAMPTIPELVRGAGGQTVIATAKTVGLLQDRHLDPARDKNCVALFSGLMQSRESLAALVSRLGPFPVMNYAQKDSWTTKALTDVFWKERVPTFSLLWLSEPDGSQHDTTPGSATALAAIKSSDENLGRVLAALDQRHLRSTTDIFVVSDHGFSTIEHSIDLRKILKEAGFDAVTEFANEPKTGQIMLAGNGGTVFFYVIGRDTAVTKRLVEFLQQSDFAGVIFTRDKLPGTFGLDEAGIDAPSPSSGAASNEHAPDVAMAFHWNENKNQFGVPGMIDADWQRKAGQGTHATIGKFDVHNILVAVGPDFRRGEVDDLPTGNIDIAPTILRILGIAPPKSLDGRILSEAMVKIGDGIAGPETKTIEATKTFPGGMWRQSLQISHLGSTTYLDQGNGQFVPQKRR